MEWIEEWSFRNGGGTTRETEGGPEPQSGRVLRSGWLSALAHFYVLSLGYAWKRTVLHVFDRGYAGAPWLGELLWLDVRFAPRGPQGFYSEDPKAFISWTQKVSKRKAEGQPRQTQRGISLGPGNIVRSETPDATKSERSA
jgi:hypothetical protein